MPSRPASARALAFGRRAFPWLVAVVALLFRPRALELTAPVSCPGLLDFTAIVALIVDPYLTLGTLLRTLDAVVVAAATAGFAHVAVRSTGSYAVAASAAIAVALSPVFPHTFTTPQAAGIFAACAATAAAATMRRGEGSRSWIRPALLAAGVLAVALIAPPWCGRLTTAFSIARIAAVAQATSWAVGPLTTALAILGVYAQSKAGRRRDAWTVACVGCLLTVLTMAGSASATVASVPLAFAIWWFAATGLAETVAAMGRRRTALAACALLLVLVPVLQAARRNAEERDDRVPVKGHDQLSLQRTRALLNAITVAGSLVQEDASVDLALRAAALSRKTPAANLVAVPSREDAVSEALARGPVYAFPRAQAALRLRGFELRPIASVGRQRNRSAEEAGGLAAIVGRRACYAAGTAWADVGDVAAAGAIAVDADSEASVGPVMLILGGSTVPSLATESWTTRMVRGFRFRVYDRRIPAEAELLVADARAMGAPLDHRALSMPVVVQVSMHRTPRGPLELPLLLNGSFPYGIARLDSENPAQRLSVCDASGVRATPFEFRATGR